MSSFTVSQAGTDAAVRRSQRPAPRCRPHRHGPVRRSARRHVTQRRPGHRRAHHQRRSNAAAGGVPREPDRRPFATRRPRRSPPPGRLHDGTVRLPRTARSSHHGLHREPRACVAARRLGRIGTPHRSSRHRPRRNRPQHPSTRAVEVVLGVGDQLVLINDRPSDTPIPQPHRAEIVRSRPFGLSDHDLAAHVIDL